MIYLPRKVREFYQDLADKSEENMGSYLLRVLIDKAFEMGLKCDHPLAFQVLHRKGKTTEQNGKVVHGKTFNRCTLCGHIYEKMPWDPLLREAKK